MSSPRRLIVTDANLERLHRLIEQHAWGKQQEIVELLEVELSRADVVTPEEVPPDVVTMNSRVVFLEEETNTRREVQLVYPQDANGDPGRVSILAPVGVALIGLSVGDSIEFPMPGGRTKRIKVLEVTWQPEAEQNAPPPPQAA